MSEFIIGKRCSGKTTELIKRSAETGSIIIVATMTQADGVYHDAKRLGLDIPKPISIKVLQNIIDGRQTPYTRNELKNKGILLDELQMLLYPLFNSIPVNALTISDCHYSTITTLPGGVEY